MAAKRIPTKGTPEYRAYWRNRHHLEDMKHRRDDMRKMIASDAPSGRRVLFELSLAAMDRAIELFDLGHQCNYLDEPPKPGKY